MRCDQARAALQDTRYAGVHTPGLDLHLAGCPACSAFAAREAALDLALARLPPAALRPGFDQRFFSRLAAEKTRVRPRRYARFGWALPLAAAGALMLLRPASIEPRVESPPAAEFGLLMELDMVRDLDVASKLDEIETYDVLSELDESDIARIAQEQP
jgi:hypothetical protein